MPHDPFAFAPLLLCIKFTSDELDDFVSSSSLQLIGGVVKPLIFCQTAFPGPLAIEQFDRVLAVNCSVHQLHAVVAQSARYSGREEQIFAHYDESVPVLDVVVSSYPVHDTVD